MTDKTRLDAMRERNPDKMCISQAEARALLDLVTAYDAEHKAVSVMAHCGTANDQLRAMKDVIYAHEQSAKAREDFENG